MKKYVAFAAALFKAQLAFRFDIFLQAAFTFAKILLAVALWGSIYQGGQRMGGLSHDQMLAYYLITSFFAQLDLSGEMGGEIAARIRGGTFARYMTMPVGVIASFGAQTAGASAFYLSFNLAALAAWKLLFRIPLPLSADPWLTIGSIAMALLGLLFLNQLNGFLGLLAFRFADVGIFLMIKSDIVLFATGALVPLSLLPAGALSALRALPFAHVLYTPAMLLLGALPGRDAAVGLINLLFWNAVFLFINRAAYHRLRVRFDGVGL